jgi:hypothetical protein
MSLAMFAASIDDNSNITLPNNSDNSDNIINQKRHKRTQRKYPKIENFDTNKVNSVLQQIHNNTDDDDDNKDDFKLLPPPESMGVSRTIPSNSPNSNNQQKQESFSGMEFPLGNKLVGKAPSPNYENSDNLDLNDYSNYGDSKAIEEYYKRILPGYRSQANKPYYNLNQNHNNQEYVGQDVLLQKLNYMISLLEDQQDEKTSNVTEEVVLYSFLGIFIIFIADTFVRAGKYVR